MTGSALFTPAPVCGSQPKTITEALALPPFNAMYQASGANGPACSGDIETQDIFEKAIVNDVIKCGGSAMPDIAFFETAFGWTEREVEATQVWNRYDCDADYNIFFEVEAKAASAGADFTATLHRVHHSKSGKYSMPAKGMQLMDVDTNALYSIEDKNVDNDYSHRLVLRPWRSDVVGEVKKNKKYLVVPVRMVGGYSCPMPMNKLPGLGWMQPVNPFRLRRDWHFKHEIMRGYNKKLRWTILYDEQGKPYDAWDAYEAQTARNDLQLARNILAFLATPINNTALIGGTGVTVVDDVHTGFYGYLPSIKYAGGNIMDFDPSEGYNLDADFEPFMLSQEALKRTTVWNIRAGRNFLVNFNRAGNRMVRRDGLGVESFPAFIREGERLKKLRITSYEYPGIGTLSVEEWGALSDSRLIGNSTYMNNLAIMTPMDGVVDINGNAIPSIEFYQYGGVGRRYTGDYWEKVVDMLDVTLCEEVKGSVGQSVMMAVHCPGQHILLNPVSVC